MKSAVKIFALILAAALCAGLFSCASVPTPPPAVTDTDAAETVGVPDTTNVPETGAVTTAAGTSAPDTKAAETTNVPVTTPAVTDAAETTGVPVTTGILGTDAVTTAPVTTLATETTVSETGPVKTHQLEYPVGRAETYKRFPDEYASGVIEPFYWFDETHVGVRGFEEIVLSAEGRYVILPQQRLQFESMINDLAAVRYFTLTEVPELNDRPHIFPLIAGNHTLAFSENCVIRYGYQFALENRYFIFIDALDPSIPVVSVLAGYCKDLEFFPISRSEDGKTVVAAERWRTGIPFFDIFKINRYELDDDFRYIEGYTQLSAIGDCNVETYGFNGLSGFLAICVARSQDGKGNIVKHYAFLATNDGGESWIIYDPQTPGTPEIELERTFYPDDYSWGL